MILLHWIARLFRLRCYRVYCPGMGWICYQNKKGEWANKLTFQEACDQSGESDIIYFLNKEVS